jgi:hypothetical protein
LIKQSWLNVCDKQAVALRAINVNNTAAYRLPERAQLKQMEIIGSGTKTNR